jgi:plasmid stabilization system protein ParE
MKRLHLKAEAEAELIDAAIYYEQQRPGLGFRFEREIDALFERISANPLQFPEVDEGRRRALLRPFPYGVFYTVDQDQVTILAVFHLRRNPDVWKSR